MATGGLPKEMDVLTKLRMVELPGHKENHDDACGKLQDRCWQDEKDAKAGCCAWHGANKKGLECMPAGMSPEDPGGGGGNDGDADGRCGNKDRGIHGTGHNGQGHHGGTHAAYAVDKASQKPGEGKEPERWIVKHVGGEEFGWKKGGGPAPTPKNLETLSVKKG